MRVKPPRLSFSGVFRALQSQDQPLGIAVSGGSDSMALLHKLRLMQTPSPDLHAVTVDHGLRPEAAQEARQVAAYCVTHDIAHDVLRWEGWDGQGNLQDQARRARYRLLAEWGRAQGVGVIALGHTADDNAETFVQGLMRGAGLDGLSGMRLSFVRGGVQFIRPMLELRRNDLRAWLEAQGVAWCDDPSNEDEGFDRVRVRKVLEQLPVEATQIAKAIGNLRATREGLQADMAHWVRRHVTQEAGDLCFDAAEFAGLSRDMRRRILNAALRWVASADYPPRADKVMMLLPKPPNSPFSVHGCIVLYNGRIWRIVREVQAVTDVVGPLHEIWDGRWRLSGPHNPGLRVAALGEEGLRSCPDWRDTGLPRSSLLASPAIWEGATLVAAPVAGNSDGWTATIVTDFHDWLVSH